MAVITALFSRTLGGRKDTSEDIDFRALGMRAVEKPPQSSHQTLRAIGIKIANVD